MAKWFEPCALHGAQHSLQQMRVGVLCREDELEWAQKLGFHARCSGCVLQIPLPIQRTMIGNRSRTNLRARRASGTFASRRLARFTRTRSTRNRRNSSARAVFRRSDRCRGAHWEVKTVAGFPGAVIETEMNERGGNPVYKPFENYIPRLLAFWEPLARYAADKGLRIAFEHCPQGCWHQPIMHYNIFGQPAMWDRVFSQTRCENIGLEWDAAHLICQFIDPVANIHKYGRRIFSVHAKDAYINRPLLETYGLCHPGVVEHRFPGLGQANWAEIVHALLRAGFDSDLNIEGWHDPVYRDHMNTD